MNLEDIDLLAANGWSVVCESPFELEFEDDYSTASGEASKVILEFYKMREKKRNPKKEIHLNENPDVCPVCSLQVKVNIIRDTKGCVNPKCENYYHKNT